MIVVINPSGGGGRSFKGLHAYCSDEQGEGGDEDGQRVEWMSTRNVATEDPEDAWRQMVATAEAQEELKQAAGMKAGRPAKHGPVIHVMMSFTKGEPTDRKAMEAAADELLATLGAKTKAREQYASEHQVVMYAHRDTEHPHVHLMINRVHPITGANLPSNNDRLRVQKWALAYSKKHGTAERTPEREENAKARQKGEYVKAKRRKSRNVFEIEQLAGETANDNQEIAAAVEKEERDRKALTKRRRALQKTQAAAQDRLAEAHAGRARAIERRRDQAINKARHETREEFRERHRALAMYQQAERATYAALEESFFGRLGNAMRVARMSEQELGHRYSSLITRTFQILTNQTKRRDHFEAAQNRARKALEHEEAAKLSERVKAARAAEQASKAQNRSTYAQERDQLEKRHKAQRAQLKERWRDHGTDQDVVLDRMKDAKTERQAQTEARSDNRQEQTAEQRRRDELRARFGDAAAERSSADKDTDRDRDRGGQKMN